ncbi:hypothetical protein ACS0TY_002165 [Phlomoides rotata]
MAYLLSICITTPFCYRESRLQGTYTRRLTGGGLINPVTRSSGKKHLMHKYCGRSMSPLNRSSLCNIYAPTRQCFEPFSCHFGVRSSVCVLLSGFWVGPDVDDGWGFVEASVHRIY